MKQTKLKSIIYENLSKSSLKESAIGNLYINIGETIEEMEILSIKLTKLISKISMKEASKINNELRHQIIKLKNLFGDSYDFKP